MTSTTAYKTSRHVHRAIIYDAKLKSTTYEHCHLSFCLFMTIMLGVLIDSNPYWFTRLCFFACNTHTNHNIHAPHSQLELPFSVLACNPHRDRAIHDRHSQLELPFSVLACNPHKDRAIHDRHSQLELLCCDWLAAMASDPIVSKGRRHSPDPNTKRILLYGPHSTLALWKCRRYQAMLHKVYRALSQSQNNPLATKGPKWSKYVF